MAASTPDTVVYRALVVDSGPIIRRTGLNTLWRTADAFYTVPAVLQEIRDLKARQHLEQLPFELIAREPSQHGMTAVVEFSRQTGDHQSLSLVDLQVLALLYDLEKEGCGDMEHVRRTPKRTVGVGKFKLLGGEKKEQQVEQEEYDVVEEDEEEESPVEPSLAETTDPTNEETTAVEPTGPKSWAMLVNPTEASATLPTEPADKTVQVSFAKMTLQQNDGPEQGQFSDAEDDTLGADDDDVSDFDSQKDFCDDECEELQEDLQSDFPSMAAASLVPYEGSDSEENEEEDDEEAAKRKADDERKRLSLKPISNSGKLYNSFRRYGNLMKPKPVKKQAPVEPVLEDKKPEAEPSQDEGPSKNQSRIIGGGAGQDIDVEDDGEGWITCTKDIHAMKAAGALDPKRNPQNLGNGAGRKGPQGPPLSQRTACTTTDFAMQNVILQMNLELLSVDGVKVRKLKSWVTRCGACFKVYTSSDNTGPHGTKRLFCERCGSDMMQRIAASVDSKTGRLRLHLSKKFKHNLRGTKFSLPKPGTQNRFQGDLLLREDQMMMGAWNQKVKMRSGGKAKSAAQSMFGRDIASNVGCNASSVSNDIKVGFGRRNPNAAKGRERRGKKKKSSDKACGLRRY